VRDLCLPTVWRLYKTTWSASLSTTTALSRPRHVSFGRRGEWRGEWHHQDVNVVSSSTLIHQTSLREGTRLEFWSPVRLWHAGCIMQRGPLSRATPPAVRLEIAGRLEGRGSMRAPQSRAILCVTSHNRPHDPGLCLSS
jgi:hypothetical protein